MALCDQNFLNKNFLFLKYEIVQHYKGNSIVIYSDLTELTESKLLHY